MKTVNRDIDQMNTNISNIERRLVGIETTDTQNTLDNIED